MNRIGIVMLMGVLSALECAAEYVPFLEVGKSWIAAVCESREAEPYCHKRISVEKKLNVDSRECFMLRVQEVTSFDGGWVDSFGPMLAYNTLAYEDNGKVYEMVTEDSRNYSPRLLFSLDMTQNEWCGPDPAAPVKTEVEVRGKKRSALYLGKVFGNENEWVVEGIGASSSFWQCEFPTRPGKHYFAYMEECYKGDELLFTACDFENLPAPEANGQLTIGADSAPERPAAYSLHGLPVEEPRDGEIYIVGGQKKIRR